MSHGWKVSNVAILGTPALLSVIGWCKGESEKSSEKES